MAKKAKESFIEKPFMRIVLAIASAVISTVVLGLSSYTILEIYKKSTAQASQYLIWIFIFVGLMSIVAFLKKRTKLNLIRCLVMVVFNIAIGIISVFGKDNPVLFSVTAGLYCISIIVSRVFSIVVKHDARSIVFNALIILFAVLVCFVMFAASSDATDENVLMVITTECIFIAVVSFLEAARIVFSQLKLKVLFKIIVNTYSLEILFGLLTMIVFFSIVLSSVETGWSFLDALWYSFAVVTTIGFGDMVATTGVGRVLTVILGLYGLIVVAVITSIIVNFYNETAGKKDAKELKEIKKEQDDE